MPPGLSSTPIEFVIRPRTSGKRIDAYLTDRFPDFSRSVIQKVIDGAEHLRPKLAEFAKARGEVLLDAHSRVRQASRARGVKHQIEAQDEPDVLGVFVYLPKVV